MPSMPRRFRSVQGDKAQPSQLAPSDPVPPDLIDIHGDLPVTPDMPSDKPDVARNPVVRQRTKRTTGLDSVSMKTYGLPSSEVQDALFPR